MLDMLTLSRKTGIWPERDVIKYIRSAIAADGLITRFAPGFNVGRYLEEVCQRWVAWEARRTTLQLRVADRARRVERTAGRGRRRARVRRAAAGSPTATCSRASTSRRRRGARASWRGARVRLAGVAGRLHGAVRADGRPAAASASTSSRPRPRSSLGALLVARRIRSVGLLVPTEVGGKARGHMRELAKSMLGFSRGRSVSSVCSRSPRLMSASTRAVRRRPLHELDDVSRAVQAPPVGSLRAAVPGRRRLAAQASSTSSSTPRRSVARPARRSPSSLDPRPIVDGVDPRKLLAERRRPASSARSTSCARAAAAAPASPASAG